MTKSVIKVKEVSRKACKILQLYNDSLLVWTDVTCGSACSRAVVIEITHACISLNIAVTIVHFMLSRVNRVKSSFLLHFKMRGLPTCFIHQFNLKG